VAVAHAYCVDEVLARREPNHLDGAAVSDEVARFDKAIAAAAEELDAIVARVSQEVGEQEAAIFRAHRLLLRDPALMARVKSAILTRHVDAPTALPGGLDEYHSLFAQVQDESPPERMADIGDVVGRIMAQLALTEGRRVLAVDEPVIVVAPEILPSQALTFDRLHVAGIITETGGT